MPRRGRSKKVLVGLDSLDDAGVYLVRKDLALVHTVDFFTPIVDDPYDFGAIAAANALSDVYAMGAVPVTALCIVCFPPDELDLSVLRKMLRGGADKLRSAGVELLGGHSVKDKEVKFGFAVTGTAEPSEIVTKSGARVGDVLVLTKPLGVGVLSTALKAGKLHGRRVGEMVRQMSRLNDDASRIMRRVGVSACTDVTGFGLLGHACEMAAGSKRTLRFDCSEVPLLKGVLDFIRKGVFPGGLGLVRRHLSRRMSVSAGVSRELVDAMCDPQTSGGLLMSVPREKADRLMRALRRTEGGFAAKVGDVVRRQKTAIVVY
ncbi:MAG: selenide, water dikinase SelD [Candidatus Eiseniibacteriota bacterium]|nr:MAG: selenide, water dikinase SelD [Candidatus Eisenbacteria bacterium]